MGDQVDQIGPFRILDQALRGLGFVVHQMADDGLHEFRTEPLMPVRFVPLIGEAGVSMEKRASASA